MSKVNPSSLVKHPVSSIKNPASSIKYPASSIKNPASSIEIHPFKPFIPPSTKFLIIGSFPGKIHTQEKPSDVDWFYGAKRNTFWKIMEQVYGVTLPDKNSKQQLFAKLKIGIADIILKAIRKEGTNSDTNLNVIEYNEKAIDKILSANNITTIFFTSKFVEKLFKKLFPQFTNTAVLPSPSPRFARMNLEEKVNVYKKLLPGI